MCAPSLKYKKHYNSFHPELGFFLHIDKVLSWFEGDSASFDKVVTNSRPCVMLKLVSGDVYLSFVHR